ncbi:hypothetical protein K493DRAFT_20829 [Basidiobolus meristosporus CBS 931.73]|uniref:Uncharacterized protein n=1 Tax=Basidiobolus meristosporus CBS 931.73 TaxID=1314790 RepID=A0A1Y1Z858_9FUNG|nr:hypothetical protein K493DRAFT_20829 [Basidiobolus meristosporus CBS 931.73]|eukprot:ORY06443.1 hypothetical protein K493DRAFT_20829 [Basidiobolus meristosporus CBS 931.73]
MHSKKSDSELNGALPPSYNSLYPEASEVVVDSKGKADSDSVSKVIATVNRMSAHFPRYQDQCASLSESQMTKMSAAALARDIDRLSRGQYTNQRATSSTQKLIQRLSQYSQQGLASQRFTMTEYQEKNLELARLSGLVKKMEKSRLEDQDFKSQSQVCEEELDELLTTLSVSKDTPLSLQRYQLSTNQEREMFIHEVLGRIHKLEGSRMLNQDAEPRTVRRERDFTELEKSLDRLPRALDEQRAISVRGRIREAFMKI